MESENVKSTLHITRTDYPQRTQNKAHAHTSLYTWVTWGPSRSLEQPPHGGVETLFFDVFFFVRSRITFGVVRHAFCDLLVSILSIPGNSENCSPSCTKTIVLQIWEGPDLHVFCICFQDQFFNTLFHIFFQNLVHFGDPRGL